jgi:hypothetical protein
VRVKYIDCNNVGSMVTISAWGICKEIAVVATTILKSEQNLLLANLGEVELGRIEWLEHTVNTELGRPLLEVAAFVELCNKPKVTRNHLGLTGCDIISE